MTTGEILWIGICLEIIYLSDALHNQKFKKVEMNAVVRVSILIMVFMVGSFFNLHAQDKDSKKGRYKVWVTKMDKSSKTKGYLLETKDNYISIMNYSSDGGSEQVDIGNIKKIKIRKKGKPLKGIVYGMFIGFSTGMLLGIASGDDNSGNFSLSAADKGFIIGTLFTIPGAIVGAIVGHRMNVKIPIKGNKDSYNAQREKLRKYQMSF